jgi:hypothetical protein
MKTASDRTLALWIASGAEVGAMVGVFLYGIGVWVAIGAGVGVAIGAGVATALKRR